jgi:ferredoxin
MTYRIVIDGLACSGFGDCAGLAPDVFELDGHGKALLRVRMSSDSTVLEAASACPMGAISVIEESVSGVASQAEHE